MDNSFAALRKCMHLHKHSWKRYFFGPNSGLLLLKLLTYTNITANQLSAFALFYVLLPLGFIAYGTQKAAIVGSILFLFIITLDHADGALARYRGIMSLTGAYLEKMYHRLIPPLLFLAVSIYTAKYYGNMGIVALGIFIMLVMFLAHWTRLSKYEIVILKTKKQIKAAISIEKKVGQQGFPGKAYNKFIYFVNSMEWLCLITLALSVTGYLHWMLAFYLPFYTLIAIAKLYLEGKSGFKEFGLGYFREGQ